MKVEKKNFVSVQDWDNLVVNTYKRPYSFQQQDGCKERGVHLLSIPDKYESGFDPFTNDTLPEESGTDEMGVSFKAWLKRDPEQILAKPGEENKIYLEDWWLRNFYPDIQVVADDLYEKGLIEAGDYAIHIDW